MRWKFKGVRPVILEPQLGRDGPDLYSFSIVLPRVTTVAFLCVHIIRKLSIKLSLLVIVVTIDGHLNFITVRL